MNIKNKKCTECGREDQPWFSRKRCRNCAQKGYKKPAKKTNSVASVKKQQKKSELTEFFERVIGSLGDSQRCTETHQAINSIGRVNIAHIFPKRTYESVMCSDNNFIVLSWQAHTDFDGYLDRMDLEGLERNFPNSWPLVLEKVGTMIRTGEVTERGKLIVAFESIIKIGDEN